MGKVNFNYFHDLKINLLNENLATPYLCKHKSYTYFNFVMSFSKNNYLINKFDIILRWKTYYYGAKIATMERRGNV